MEPALSLGLESESVVEETSGVSAAEFLREDERVSLASMASSNFYN